ncbi:GNAT family N-acetyltransferase [Bryobacter aggregatus]|uniref:GNAT family N-acetyltransferase n=1 Tax=Bryobacter aggregatus TaxID=360054 RepID=UPI0004E15521|nr:GNAT family N-acetyltransferase [Bryobacter aggregatus]
MGFSARVRPSTEADVAAITAIYAHYVRTGTATFELDAPDHREMMRRRAAILDHNFPHLVAESEDEEILGYCSAGPYRLRPAYRFTMEDSIYVAHTATGQGIGKLLLSDLLLRCEALGCREMIAVIGGSSNYASIRLHEHFGFTHVGTLRHVGFKFDTWLDTVLMQRSFSGTL